MRGVKGGVELDMTKKIIGITMGDPASIGPEISAKVLVDKEIYDRCNPLIIGDASTMRKALELIGKEDFQVNAIKDVEDAVFTYGTIDVYDLENADMNLIKPGLVSKEAGEASFQYVDKVIDLALEGKIHATVTNAFNKEAINLAGYNYSGHTEFYAEKTKTEKYTMLLAHENLRVLHVSTHVSLREACDLVKKDRVYDLIVIGEEFCKKIGIEKPKIAVAGLNPHSSENGLFGHEEMEEIIPAIQLAKEKGIDVDGPVPPDTVFSKAYGGMYDIVVAMYHDQGHIPLKVLGFVYDKERQVWKEISGVNITLGLPIIRTSVDHGTAFGKAWKGTASELSLKNAIDYAIRLSKN